MVDDIGTVFRDFNNINDPSSGDYEPEKARIRALLRSIRSLSGQAITKGTLAELTAVTPPTENYMGIVLDDPDPTNNGYYSRVASAWVFERGFPDTFAVLTSIGGTANAITASTETGVDPADVLCVLLPDPPGTNSSATVTLTLNGGSAESVKAASGANLAVGDIIEGVGTLFFKVGSEWRQLFSSATGATFDHQGDWDSGTTYTEAQIVTGSNGNWYQLKVPSSLNDDPVSGGSGDWLTILDSAALADGSVTFAKLADALVQTDAEGGDADADDEIPTVKRVVSLIKEVGFGIIPNCVGDGTADDTSGFLAACTAALTLGAWVELDPEKSYNLETWTPLAFDGRLKIKCNGAAIIGPGTGANQYFAFPEGGGFDIDGGVWSNWYGLFQRWNYKWGESDPLFPGVSANIGASTDKLSDSKFTNNTVTGCTGFVFNIGILIDEMLIEGNIFQSCSGGYVLRLGEKVVGEFWDSWKGFRIRRNKFLNLTAPTDSSVSSMVLYGGGPGDILDNRVFNVVGNGSGDAWGMYFQSPFLVVSGNHVDYVTTTGTSTDITGISQKGGQDDSGGFVEQSGIAGKIFANYVSRINIEGTYGTGIKSQARRTRVFANECVSCTYAGIAMDNLLGSQDQSANDNVLIACKRGVTLTGNGSRYQCNRNSIFVCDVGILFAPGTFGANTSISMIQIKENLIGNTSGIGLQFLFNASTSNLDVFDNLLACDVGIDYLAGSTYPTVSNYRLYDNRADLSTTNTTGTAPSGVDVR